MKHSTWKVTRLAPVDPNVNPRPDELYLDVYEEDPPGSEAPYLRAAVLRRGNPDRPLPEAPDGLTVYPNEVQGALDALTALTLANTEEEEDDA